MNEAGEYVLGYAKARELTVGAQESVPKSMLAGAISKGQTFQIRVIEGTGSELFELLLAGKIDVFIANFRPLADGKEMIYTSLGKESVSVWGATSEAKLKANFPKSLNGQRFTAKIFPHSIYCGVGQ